MLLNLLDECIKEPYADLISSVIVITVSGEVTLDSVINYDAVLITDCLNLSVLDSRKGIDNV